MWSLYKFRLHITYTKSTSGMLYKVHIIVFQFPKWWVQKDRARNLLMLDKNPICVKILISKSLNEHCSLVLECLDSCISLIDNDLALKIKNYLALIIDNYLSAKRWGKSLGIRELGKYVMMFARTESEDQPGKVL